MQFSDCSTAQYRKCQHFSSLIDWYLLGKLSNKEFVYLTSTYIKVRKKHYSKFMCLMLIEFKKYRMWPDLPEIFVVIHLNGLILFKSNIALAVKAKCRLPSLDCSIGMACNRCDYLHFRHYGVSQWKAATTESFNWCFLHWHWIEIKWAHSSISLVCFHVNNFSRSSWKLFSDAQIEKYCLCQANGKLFSLLHKLDKSNKMRVFSDILCPLKKYTVKICDCTLQYM